MVSFRFPFRYQYVSAAGFGFTALGGDITLGYDPNRKTETTERLTRQIKPLTDVRGSDMYDLIMHESTFVFGGER
ncbi:hypothetical protein FACS1894189_6390 [Planctomycetales bacterium]|nr:hypothetical protein FACS1894189_6390 [Planctomycetales bacterium]